MKLGWIPAALSLGAAVFLVLHRQAQKKSLSRELKAKEELLRDIKRFSGRFQPLAKALEAQSARLVRKHLDIWQAQASGMAHLSAFLASLRGDDTAPLDSAAALMRTLERWGIQHDTADSVFPITPEKEALYVFDDVYGMESRARVVRPAWWVQTEGTLICIETGAAEIEYGE